MKNKRYLLILNNSEKIYFDYITKKIFDLIYNNKWDLLKYEEKYGHYVRTDVLYKKLNNM